MSFLKRLFAGGKAQSPPNQPQAPRQTATTPTLPPPKPVPEKPISQPTPSLQTQEYMCDICGSALRRQQITRYPNCRIVLRPSYWEGIYERGRINGDLVGMHISMMMNSSPSFGICTRCNETLAQDKQKPSEYGLKEYAAQMMSNGERPDSAAPVVAGVIWKKRTGQWPSSIAFRNAKLAKRYGAPVAE